jgi:serine/threonine-protein kinase
VLYEMLTGEPPHMGTSAQQIIMKIIAEPVKPATELRKSVPPNVAAALAKALEKIPADRFGSASDFAGALSNPSFRTGTSAAAVAGTDRLTVPGGSLSWRAVAGVLAAAFVALAAWAATRERTPASSALVMRAELDVLSHSDSDATVSGLDISPDGSAIVYAAAGAGSGRFQLYMRRLDDRIARPIPGTEGGEWPTFSPDGASIAFVHEGRNIRRVATGGGVSEAVEQGGNRSDFRNLRWGADGFLYYRNAAGDALMRVPAAGGTPKRLLAAGTPQEPEPLPGGRHVLFTECCGIDSDVGVVDVETSETRWLGVRARSVRYLETGHLVLMAGDAMRVVPFDARNLSVQGEPLTLLDSAAANGTVGSLAIATSGTAAYLVRPTRVDAAGYRVALVDLAGSEQLTALPDANFREFRFSPDGRRIAFASSPIDRPNRWGVSVHDLAVGSTVPLTKQPVDFAGNLLWQHDGTRLLYVVDYEQRDSTTVIESSRSDGEGNPTTMWKRRILEGQSVYLSPWSVTSDGKRVLLMREHQGDFDLLTAPLDSAIGDPRDYVVGTGRQRRPVLSPDNQWVAYESDEEAPATAPNRTQIYARAFPEPGPRYAVSDSGGTSPRWSPDGKTLYYVRGRTLVAASVTTSPAFRVTSRRNLFTRASAITAYDISPDGKQFVMRAPARAVMPAQAARPVYEPPRVVVVVNWMEELRRKLAGQW